jgi:hypothetical protein
VLAFVDESGCLGMKLGAGSSPYFGVVAVLFHDLSEANRCDKHIGHLRDAIGVKKEFHFNSCRHDQRTRFFYDMDSFDFCYFGVVFDKKKIAQQHLKFSRPFLHFPVQTIFAGMAAELDNTIVVIDRTGSSEFRKTMAKDLKAELNQRFGRHVIKKVKDECSHSNNLLQLADMVCSAVTRSFVDEKKEPGTYRRMIAGKERFVSIVP